MTEPGYEIGRDEKGLTARERRVLQGLKEKKSHAQIATEIGVTKQRVTQLVRSLREKGAWNG